MKDLLPSECGGQDSFAFDSVQQREDYRRGPTWLSVKTVCKWWFRGDDDEVGRADFIGASIRKPAASPHDNAIPKIAFFPLFIHQERQRAYRVQTLTVRAQLPLRRDDILHLTIISIGEAKRSSSLMEYILWNSVLVANATGEVGIPRPLKILASLPRVFFSSTGIFNASHASMKR